jgi:protein-arginine kinase activator protein McsA
MAKKKLYRYDDFYKMNLTVINKTRVDAGLKPIEYKTRNCLKCDASFESMGPSNRICENCYGHDEGLQSHSIKKPR